MSVKSVEMMGHLTATTPTIDGNEWDYSSWKTNSSQVFAGSREIIIRNPAIIEWAQMIADC